VQAHAPNCAIIGEGSDVGLASTIRSIEACGMLGIHNMVIHTASSSLYRYPQDRKGYYDGNRPFLTALIPYMEKYDVSILLENTCAQHTNGTYFPITGEDLVDMAEDLNHPLFGVMWDVGHAHIQGVDQYEAIMTIGENLKAVHIHDNNGIYDSHYHPYQGKVPFEAILNGLVDSGYNGYFTLEAFSLPIPTDNGYGQRPALELDGVVYDRLRMLPLPLKIRSEHLMIDTARFMLDAYGCLED
jgi:sugar phosphate isomerase/epimerase